MIGLGPGFEAGRNCDLAIETQWGDRLGALVRSGPTAPLAGEPRSIEGVGRERILYAPLAGILETYRAIGDPVAAGARLAMIGAATIEAPLPGTVRGLTRGGTFVVVGDKIAEVDPRPPAAAAFAGLGSRPVRIAGTVLSLIGPPTKSVSDRTDRILLGPADRSPEQGDHDEVYTRSNGDGGKHR